MRVGRRQFVQGAGVAGLAMLVGCAPPAAGTTSAKVYRVGYLLGGPTGTDLKPAVLEGMSALGYHEGQNLIIEERIAAEGDSATAAAAELASLRVDAILVPSSSIAVAARAATNTIAIVSTGAGDLVTQGLAASNARPGGNVTGLSTPSLAGKQLQLLREAVPAVRRVIGLFDVATNFGADGPYFQQEQYDADARALGLTLQMMGVGSVEHLEPALQNAARAEANGLLILFGPLTSRNQARINELAMQHRLPTMWQLTDGVGRGGLLGYGPNRAAMYRRSASYLDKILRGAKPADLPIEHPREFEFAVNLRTAQSLGITIPASVLAQATEVIQ
jgi:putative ABC transport system substrate-binding protein